MFCGAHKLAAQGTGTKMWGTQTWGTRHWGCSNQIPFLHVAHGEKKKDYENK